MFSGFKIDIDMSFFDSRTFCELVLEGNRHLMKNAVAFSNNMYNFWLEQEEIDGTIIQNDYFPEVNADVFISHSRKDVNLANALAGWLHKEFGLSVFVDSNVWGLADDLLNKLSMERCWDKYMSQHVYIMLCSALHNMIDKVESVFFLNTDNSIRTIYDYGNKINKTYSPWIYSELLCTQIVRKKPLYYYRDYKKIGYALESAQQYTDKFFSFLIFYEVNLSHLIEIGSNDLNVWWHKYHNFDYEYPLDALYCDKLPDELEKAKIVSGSSDNEHYKYLKIMKAAIDGDYEAQRKIFSLKSEFNADRAICNECRGMNCKFCIK